MLNTPLINLATLDTTMFVYLVLFFATGLIIGYCFGVLRTKHAARRKAIRTARGTTFSSAVELFIRSSRM